MDLVKSYEMRSRLADAARITQETGHEAGFRYYLDLESGDRYWSPVFEGLTDEMPEYLFDDWLVARRLDPTYVRSFLSLHFHPTDDGLAPSSSDLLTMFTTPCDDDFRETYGVSTISDDNTGAVLLYSRNYDPRPRPGLEPLLLRDVSERLDDLPDTASGGDICQALAIAGFVIAATMRYSLVSTECGSARWVDLSGLAAFSH